MKINLLAVGAFAAVLALPLGAYAQQDQPPAQQAHGRTTTPSQSRIQSHWAKRFNTLNLSGDQQQRIQSLINQYSQAHPEGSPRDRNASRDLRHQIMGVLSDDQRNAYRQQMRAHRAQMRQRQQGQMQGQYQNQGPGDQQQYDQGPGPQEQGPPQQGPPNEGPPQQGPPNEGPPPNQGPPDQQPPAGQSGPPPA